MGTKAGIHAQIKDQISKAFSFTFFPSFKAGSLQYKSVMYHNLMFIWPCLHAKFNKDHI